jgi:hypothetical protein
MLASRWINLKDWCLTGMWRGCFDYEGIILPEESTTKPTVTSIAQDIYYAATYMVWTVLTIVIIYCGLGYIIASRDWKDTNTYKKWLTNAAIGSLLVRWAYTIVRIIQYIAKW